jgi:hypothetical protein
MEDRNEDSSECVEDVGRMNRANMEDRNEYIYCSLRMCEG